MYYRLILITNVRGQQEVEVLDIVDGHFGHPGKLNSADYHRSKPSLS